MRQRLLAVHVLAEPHGGDAGHGVRVIRRAHDHRVDLFVHLIQQFAEVVVRLGAWKLLGFLAQPPGVDVAQGHDIRELRDLIRVTRSLAADADAGDVDLLVRGPAQRPRRAATDPKPGGGRRTGAQKTTTTRTAAHHRGSFIKALGLPRMAAPQHTAQPRDGNQTKGDQSLVGATRLEALVVQGVHATRIAPFAATLHGAAVGHVFNCSRDGALADARPVAGKTRSASGRRRRTRGRSDHGS